MVGLTATEKKVLNNLTEVLNADVSLGDWAEAFIDSLPESGTPVNAVAAAGVLTISSVSIHGEKVTIGADVYEFAADEAQTVDEGNIPVDITSYTVKATRNLTVDTQPTSGDQMTIGTKVYTFVPDGTANADGEITIGTSLSTAQDAIVDAINGDDDHNDPHPLATIAAFSNDIAAVTALIGGTAGNAIATTETFTANTNIFAGATLAGGGNCSGANTITALAAEILASGTEPITATADSGHIDIAADVPGAAGLAIVTTETMANGSFAHAHLLGGVDGTVAAAGKLMFDGSYLYIAKDDNTIVDANWRRITLGSVY
jgi:hypothetical protein